MSHGRHTRRPEVLDQLASKQRNILWPGTLVNSRSVDKLLWRGSPGITVVQRIGVCIFGLAYLASAGVALVIAKHERSLVFLSISVGFVLLGTKVIFNGLRGDPSVKRQKSQVLK